MSFKDVTKYIFLKTIIESMVVTCLEWFQEWNATLGVLLDSIKYDITMGAGKTKYKDGYDFETHELLVHNKQFRNNKNKNLLILLCISFLPERLILSQNHV